MKLSIIIVNYNVEYFLEQCLLSVRTAIRNINAEIFVVDNNSVDGSIRMLNEKFPEIRLIENNKNVGFAKANNQAIREATGEYILLLNPDTIVEEDTFDKCITFMENTADAGALGVKMINGKGEFLPESKRGLPLPMVAFYKIFGFSKIFPKSKRFGSYHLSYLNNDEVHAVDVLSGAFMMMRKEALDKCGLLDEDYFMYGEDIDLSYRITKAGYKNYYFPETTIIHYKGESTKKGSLNYVFIFYKAMQIFAEKHFSFKNSKFFNILINFAIWFRAAFSAIKRILSTLFQPVVDFLLIFSGMLLLTNYWEHTVLEPRDSSFPDEFRFFVIPIYILIWIISIAICHGYKKPRKLSNTNKGILLGTTTILLIYALLPEYFRFSRAIIVFGAMWTVIALNCMRYILHLLIAKNYIIGVKLNRRVAIIGKKEECKRVHTLVQNLYRNVNFIGIITPDMDEGKSSLSLGTIGEMDRIIPVFNINEIVFCSKDIGTSQIIEFISRQKFRAEYKIISPGSNAFIGSNSIISANSLYSASSYSLTRKNIKNKKRAFDICFSIVLLLFVWLAIWFVRNKFSFIRNIFRVISGKVSWVGYLAPDLRHPDGMHHPGILSPEMGVRQYPELSETIISKLNDLYIDEYHISHDMKIIFRAFPYLGKEPDIYS